MGALSRLARLATITALAGALSACAGHVIESSGSSGGTGQGGAAGGSGGTGVTGTTGTGASSTGTGGTGTGGGGGAPIACLSDLHGKPFALGDGGAYTLSPPVRIEVPGDFYNGVFVGDVTGDGRADVVGNDLDHFTVFQQTDLGDLAGPVAVPHAFYNPSSLALVQAGGDGALDVVILGDDGLDVFPSLGEGQFGPANELPGFEGYWLLAADLDFDGIDDLVWYSPIGIAHSYGDGAGAFTEPVAIEDGPLEVWGWLTLGDMTGDMIPDLVTPNSPVHTSLVIVPHDGVSAPSSTGWGLVPFATGAIAGYDIGDVNADGRTDVAWQEADNNGDDVRTFLMLAEPGGFGAPFEIGHDAWPGTVKIADLNADGRGDVVALHLNSLAVILSTPAGMAPQQVHDYPFAASTSYSVDVGDVDCDGCPDVVTADAGGLIVYHGQGCSP